MISKIYLFGRCAKIPLMIHEVLEDVQGALNAGASEAAVLRVLHALGFP